MRRIEQNELYDEVIKHGAKIYFRLTDRAGEELCGALEIITWCSLKILIIGSFDKTACTSVYEGLDDEVDEELARGVVQGFIDDFDTVALVDIL